MKLQGPEFDTYALGGGCWTGIVVAVLSQESEVPCVTDGMVNRSASCRSNFKNCFKVETTWFLGLMKYESKDDANLNRFEQRLGGYR